jgi:protocatechuate 3,4-dioxygenase alpha subunit
MSQPPLLRSSGGQGQDVATPSQTVGPFFHFALAPDERLGSIAASAVGERLHLRVRVIDGAGRPLPDALVEIYQANAAGDYGSSGFAGFGRLPTGNDGGCVFDTIRPGRVGGQAAHVNVCLFARGLLRHLYTRVYFTGDPDLDSDPLLAVVPADRRATLLATPAAGVSGSWEWDVHLQGPHETVFFDL